MAKKYYWLKLKEDFFENDDIKLIESIPNGKDYIIFYLKLLCKSLKNDGVLRYKNIIPYTPEMLSSITGTNIDIVNGALDKFKALNMIEFLDDGALFMVEIQNMLGSETSWAKVKREQRKKLDNVQTLSAQFPENIEICPTEIDIEKEKEKEKRDRVDYQQIADMYNETCVSFPKCTALSESRKKAIKARLKTYSVDDFRKLFEKAQKSSFLKGKNNSNWSANFDWLIKDGNMVKVLDGNYDDKEEFINGSCSGNVSVQSALQRGFI